MINKIKKSTEYDTYIEYVEDRPFNDKRYYISNDKLKKLGWKITKDFLTELDYLINQ
jgi:dTDP-D-glucose 4,6-dehydratase